MIYDPFIVHGYGIKALFDLLKGLIKIFSILSILSIFQFWWFSDGFSTSMWEILSPDITLGPGTGTSYTNKIIMPVLDNSLYIKCEKSVIQDWKNEEEF
jgi:hypothetical protein